MERDVQVNVQHLQRKWHIDHKYYELFVQHLQLSDLDLKYIKYFNAKFT